MATSFIRILSKAGWPDNPIKRRVWLKPVWANTGLFQLCVCLYVEISMSLCQCAMVYSQNSVMSLKSLKAEMTLTIFTFQSRNGLFHELHFLSSHNYTIVQLDLGNE